MIDHSSVRIEANLHLRLMDHIWLQLWSRWISLPRILALFVLCVPVVTGAVSLANGVPLKEFVHGLPDEAALYAEAILVGLVMIIAIPLALAAVQWVTGKSVKEMSVTLSDAGATYASREFNVTLHWESIPAFSETGSAFLLRGKRVLLRLPKRELQSETFPAIREIFKRNGVHRVSALRFR